jgi:Zn-dependent protease
MGSGYLQLGRVARVPIRFHWTVLLALGAVTAVMRSPLAWLLVLVVILCHEAGHAALVRRFRLSVLSIDVHALGGVCRYSGSPTDVQRCIIAWGGVLGQAVLFGACAGLASLIGRGGRVRDVLDVISAANVALAFLNLLPLRRFDGAEAWQLFRPKNLRALLARARRSSARADLRAQERRIREELARIEARAGRDASDDLLN